MTLAEGRRACLSRAGCKALPPCAAACGEEEEARKKQAELWHRGEGELGPGLLGARPLGCGDNPQGQGGDIGPAASFCRNWGRDAPGRAGRSEGWGSRMRFSSFPGANSAAKWSAAIPKGQQRWGWMGGKCGAFSGQSSPSTHLPPPPPPPLLPPDPQPGLSADNNTPYCKTSRRTPKAAPAL